MKYLSPSSLFCLSLTWPYFLCLFALGSSLPSCPLPAWSLIEFSIQILASQLVLQFCCFSSTLRNLVCHASLAFHCLLLDSLPLISHLIHHLSPMPGSLGLMHSAPCSPHICPSVSAMPVSNLAHLLSASLLPLTAHHFEPVYCRFLQSFACF